MNCLDMWFFFLRFLTAPLLETNVASRIIEGEYIIVFKREASTEDGMYHVYR